MLGRDNTLGSGQMRNSKILVATAIDFAVLRDGQRVADGRWENVVRARALKRDEFTTDLVCLVLTLHDGSEFLTHEEAPGWAAFLAAAEAALPGMRPRAAWWPELVRPAFARSEMVLFERSAAAG